MASNNEVSPRNTRQIWILLFLILAAFLFFWFGTIWVNYLVREKRQEPFYQVTNRDFSLFLWQNPSFMRANVQDRIGYLPHFSADNEIKLIPKYADKFLSATPDIFFQYHVWARLLKESSLAGRPIYPHEFAAFLKENCEWLPRRWKQASKEYALLVRNLKKKENADLQNALPFEVRLAFQGWKNYYMEWEQIEHVHPTKGKLAHFLKEHPHYNRSFWRNILIDKNPDYLKSFLYGSSIIIGNQEEEVPEIEMMPFLKIGYYNWKKSIEAES